MSIPAPASTPAHRLGGTSLPAPAEASTILRAAGYSGATPSNPGGGHEVIGEAPQPRACLPRGARRSNQPSRRGDAPAPIPTPAVSSSPETSALPGRLANAAGQGRLSESAPAGAERGSVSAHRYGVSSLSIIWPGASRLPAFFDYRRA